MTSAAPYLQIRTFRDAVAELARLDEEIGASLRRQLGRTVVVGLSRELSAPPEVERAFAILYEASSEDGPEAVLADIQGALPKLTVEEVDHLRTLLLPDEAANDRIATAEQRDGFLPLLQGIKSTVDLRFVTVREQDHLVPVITMRLSFNDLVPVLGQDSLTVQVPVPMLAAIESDAQGLRETLQGLKDKVRNAAVPDWTLDE